MRYRFAMRSFLALCIVLLTGPAHAAASAWQEVAPETRMRLVSSDRLEDGHLLAGVELDMPAGFKTYWRVPGETGIPTQIEDTGSQGFSDPQVLWPQPTIDQTESYLDFVYYGPTVLPLRLAAETGTGTISLSVTMGVCSDICVPVQAQFELPVDTARPDAGQDLRLQQALANVPIAPEDDGIVGEVVLASDGLHVPLLSTEIDSTSVIVAAADPQLLFGAPQKSPDTGLVVLPLLGGDEQSVVGQTVDISFQTPAGPYVVQRVVASPGST